MNQNDLDNMPLHERIKRLEQRQANVEKTLGTFIGWVAQSAGSPISIRNAEELLKMLYYEPR